MAHVTSLIFFEYTGIPNHIRYPTPQNSHDKNTYDLEKLSDNIKNNSKDFQKMAFLGNVLFSALSHTKAGK